MSRQKVVTTVKEYDAEGRLVKETTTETEYEWPSPAVQTPYVQPNTWPTYPNRWWSQAQQTYTAKPGDPGTYTINAASPSSFYTLNEMIDPSTNRLRIVKDDNEGDEGAAVVA